MFGLDINQIIVFLQKRMKILLVLFACVVLVFLSFFFLSKWKQNQEFQTKDRLRLFQESLKSLEKEPETKDNLFGIPEEVGDLVFTEEMKVQAKAYKQAILDNQKAQISSYFVIDLAEFYYRYGEKEEAMQLLSHFASPQSKQVLNQMASFQLASYFMNDKNCEKALDLFEKLLLNKSAEGFYNEVRLQKAICLEHLGRSQVALNEYDKMIIENPKTAIARQAKDYKKLLILKQKLNKEKESKKAKPDSKQNKEKEAKPDSKKAKSDSKQNKEKEAKPDSN